MPRSETPTQFRKRFERRLNELLAEQRDPPFDIYSELAEEFELSRRDVKQMAPLAMYRAGPAKGSK